MIEQNLLYPKQPNRYLNNGLRLKPTTLIIGAKCSDGVVLTGDRKVTSGLGDTYIDKIRKCPNRNWAVFGAAGIGTLFEEFLTKLPPKIETHANWIQYQNQRLLTRHSKEFGNAPNITSPPTMIYNAQDFKQDCVELLTEMRKQYSIAFADPNCRLDVLIGLAVTNEPSKLFYIDSAYCLPAEVNDVITIGQTGLAEVFRKSWESTMTMKQTAMLGMFAITYIEQEGISDGIGIGSQQPQVWYIPNDRTQRLREVTGEELTAMVKSVDEQVSALRTQMHSLFRS